MFTCSDCAHRNASRDCGLTSSPSEADPASNTVAGAAWATTEAAAARGATVPDVAAEAWAWAGYAPAGIRHGAGWGRCPFRLQGAAWRSRAGSWTAAPLGAAAAGAGARHLGRAPPPTQLWRGRWRWYRPSAATQLPTRWLRAARGAFPGGFVRVTGTRAGARPTVCEVGHADDVVALARLRPAEIEVDPTGRWLRSRRAEQVWAVASARRAPRPSWRRESVTAAGAGRRRRGRRFGAQADRARTGLARGHVGAAPRRGPTHCRVGLRGRSMGPGQVAHFKGALYVWGCIPLPPGWLPPPWRACSAARRRRTRSPRGRGSSGCARWQAWEERCCAPHEGRRRRRR